ncbi:MAG: SDR family oxidoreductase [bacterium]
MPQGKVALVTGSAKRTGKAIAQELARCGAEVIVHYNKSEEEALQVSKQLTQMGGQSYPLRADLSQPSQIEEMCLRAVERSGRIDILVNNVGTYLVKDIEKVTPGEWEHQMNTTVNATFYMCRAVLPLMVEQKFGRIINLADSCADIITAWPKWTPYMVGKTGVLILSKSLAVKYAKHNITVNCVSPGIIDNSIWKPELEDIPAGRFAQYSDITNAILFLVKEKSSYITGANLKVTGGWYV